METRRRWTGLGGATLLATAVVAVIALSPSAARAEPDPGPDYPADSCYDPNIDCGSGASETGVFSESWAAYEYSPGTCRTRWARATRRNLAHMIVFRYNQQVRWCYRNNVITYFWRDRWPSNTAFGWSFDGHTGTNCAYEHCPGRGVGTYSTTAWTQGEFHVCLAWYCVHKYPLVSIWVHGDGGSGASAGGA
ncbi:MAG: hypothetical protein ACJ743_07100 [Gaiellaceae bacterium]